MKEDAEIVTHINKTRKEIKTVRKGIKKIIKETEQINQIFEDKKREIGDAAEKALLRHRPNKREIDVNEFRF